MKTKLLLLGVACGRGRKCGGEKGASEYGTSECSVELRAYVRHCLVFLV